MEDRSPVLTMTSRSLTVVGMARRKSPHVSVLIPVRDAAGTLEASLRSIVRQTLTDWECVLVDDGSVDATACVISDFTAADRRFRVIRQGRQGLVPALNTGLEACTGKFTARMDGDDIMHRRRLELQSATLQADSSLDAAGCHVRLFPRDGLGEGILSYESWINSIDKTDRLMKEAFVECPVAHPTLMGRTSLLQKMRYRDMGWPEDYDLVLRLLERGARVAVVPRRLLGWRHGPGRLSMTDSRYGVDRFISCKAHFLCRSFLAGTDRYTLWGYGSTGKGMRRALERSGKRPRRIVEIHPGKIGQEIDGAMVVAPSEVSLAVDRPMLVSVAGEQPRAEIRRFLAERGMLELQDYICTA